MPSPANPIDGRVLLIQLSGRMETTGPGTQPYVIREPQRSWSRPSTTQAWPKLDMKGSNDTNCPECSLACPCPDWQSDWRAIATIGNSSAPPQSCTHSDIADDCHARRLNQRQKTPVIWERRRHAVLRRTR